jgi:hypothetical protein
MKGFEQENNLLILLALYIDRDNFSNSTITDFVKNYLQPLLNSGVSFRKTNTDDSIHQLLELLQNE